MICGTDLDLLQFMQVFMRNEGERTESKCRKDDHDLWYGPRPPAVHASFHAPSVAMEWVATASSATAATLGAQETQWSQALDKGP